MHRTRKRFSEDDYYDSIDLDVNFYRSDGKMLVPA